MHQGISNPAHSMANVGGGGSGGGGGTSTTTQNIPEELKPLATRYTQDAIALSNQQYTPYTQQRYADLNGVQNQAMGLTAQRALNGSATMDNAESNLNQMIDGGSNPYLESMVNRSLDQVQGRVNSQFGGNNYGSTAHQQTLQTGLGDTANAMYGQAYDSDQNRRLSAISQAPTFGNQAYTDASQLAGVGQQLQDQSQQGLDFNYQQFTDAQNDPYRKLAAMSGVFGSNLGGSSTTQSTQSGGGGK
jgi:hypothetical protein